MKIKAAIYINPRFLKNNHKQIFFELKKYINKLNWQLVLHETDINKINKAGKRKNYRVLVVWQFEHLGSSLVDLQSNLFKLQENNIDFVFVKDKLNSLENKASVYSLIEKLTAFASRTRRNKIRSGIGLARAKGKVLGRPATPDEVFAKAHKLRAQGLIYNDIGQILKIDESTIRKKLNKKTYDNKRK